MAPRTKSGHRSGAQQQELHQELLQKLALHLAAQPDALQQSPYTTAPQTHKFALDSSHFASYSSHSGKGSRQTQQLSPQEQELHQQMLQKLALHLAAQPDAVSQSPYSVAPPAERMHVDVSHFES